MNWFSKKKCYQIDAVNLMYEPESPKFTRHMFDRIGPSFLVTDEKTYEIIFY